MRLAFWRAGKDKPVVQRAVARPAPSAPKPVAAHPQSGDLDLHALGQALMRKRGWIIVPTVLALVASLAAVNMITPRYKSEARILVDGRENVFLRPNGERNEERSALDAEAVTSQVQLVQSRDLAREIIKKNKLAERPGIRSGAARFVAAEIVAGPGRHRTRPVLADAGRARAGGLLRALHGLCGRQVPRHRRRIPVARSRTCRARRQLDRGRLSGAAAGRAAAAGEGPRASGCRARSTSLRKKVSEAESRVEDFRSKSSLFVGTNNTTLSNQQMGEINTQLNNARALKSDAETKARLIKRDAAERQADRGFRSAQFRTDPPAVRAAGDAARATGRAVLDAARRPSPHQGIEGAACRSRSPVARGGEQDLPLAGERRAPRRRPGRRPDRRASTS